MEADAVKRHLAASESKIDSIKYFSLKNIPKRTKFYGDRPNGIVDVLQSPSEFPMSCRLLVNQTSQFISDWI